MNKVLITGTTGFIGSHVAELFSRQAIQVYCLARKGSAIDYIEKLPVQIIRGDILSLDDMMRVTKGMDCVVHIAAKVCDWGDKRDFYAVNVIGTLNLMEACKRNRVNKIILTGSISSYGEENCFDVKNESSPYNSHYPYFLDNILPCAMNYYRDTKAIATERSLCFACENKMNVIVLEPVWVYGEREFSSGFYEFMKVAKQKVPFFPGSLKNNFHVVYVKDLANAYFKAFHQDFRGVSRIIIGNHQVAKMSDILGRFCDAIPATKPRLIPKYLIYPFAFALETIYFMLKIRTPPVLTRGRVNMFYDNIEYAVNKAQKEIGFRSEYPLDQGIKDTVEWYKQNNLI